MLPVSNDKQKTFAEKVAVLREEFQRRKGSEPTSFTVFTPPRYDRHYFEGLAWLDNLAGDEAS
jgi:hypothetical protein